MTADDELLPPQASAAELIAASGDVADERGGTLRMALSNAMVGLKKQYYGKGPSRARAYLMDEYVFVVMEGGLTRNEETLLAAGKGHLVRSYRLAFQETVAQSLERLRINTAAAERLADELEDALRVPTPR